MYFKQIDEIVAGTKTCTQRVVKPNEYEHVNGDGEITLVMTVGRQPRTAGSQYNPGRVKWQVGRDYDVSPGRGKLRALVNWTCQPPHILLPDNGRELLVGLASGHKSLRIRVLQIECVPLHSTDERVALAEGVENLAAYIDLWGVINGVKAWLRNPMVWRLWFEVVTAAPTAGEGS